MMTGLAAMSISQLAVIGTIISGVYLISAGQMSLGALSASTLLVGRMMSPMSQLGSSIHRLVQIRRSSKSVELILKAEQESVGDPASARSAINGDLRFTSVGFTYPGEQLPALKDINLRIAAGERVGIIGGAGSGKSTLLRLILRLLEPSEGALLIDDRDMRQTAPDNLRRHFGFMSQDAMLFDDTIRNAVCFGIDRVEEADFLAAVKIAGVADFAARHPMGYSMRIGPRAERLSGGERQSVMLARTLVGRPRCLVLDEPTAAIDNTMEMKIVADLKASLGDRGLIVATHRAPMIALVDRLIWLERGRILADGPKEEVLRKLSEKRVA
jgi:ATP-binding cassette subfamily C protein LapB